MSVEARKNILDRPIPRGRNLVSTSAFSFLFSEIVQYSQARVERISDLERKLEALGQAVGVRVAELVSLREKGGKRETRIVNALQFVSNTCWRSLFGKPADGLEKSRDTEDEYMIVEREPLTNRFVSVPKDMGQLNCASFNAGIVRGILECSGFPARVSAYLVDPDDPRKERTVYLVKFAPEVLERERRLG